MEMLSAVFELLKFDRYGEAIGAFLQLSFSNAVR
jgi:hypothetical protein